MVRVVRHALAGTGREEAAPTELSPIELLAGAAAGHGEGAASRSAPSSSSSKKHITRNRPVQNCTECRKRKHKCDRQKPVCQHCIASGRRAKCIYRDDRPSRRAVVVSSSASSSSTRPVEVHNGVVLYVAPQAGHSTALHTRLAAVRNEALIEVLNDHDDLQLPSLDEADTLFRLWRNAFESLVRCAMSDLNVPRYERCLVWWHARKQNLSSTSPAPDPSSFPLMLVVLAHCLQIQRNTPAVARPTAMSSERKLIRVAGDCIDALQAACPPSWAAAFTAPLDLIKAAALRGRWFLHGVRYQMAGSCFAAAAHLACAAGLHRDPRHWPSMRAEEGEARRQLWWYVVGECLSVNRLEQFSVLLPDPDTFDTDLPVEPAAVENQQTDAVRAYVDSTLLHRRLPFVFDLHEFHYHTAKHRWTRARLLRTIYARKEGVPLPPARVAELDALHVQLTTSPTLPEQLHWSEEQDDQLARMLRFDAAADEKHGPPRHFLQRAVLHLEYNLHRLELHMPRTAIDAERSLAECLSATQALVAIVAGLLNIDGLPPTLIEPFLHASLMTGMVLTLAMGGGGGAGGQAGEQLGGGSTVNAASVLLAPLLRRLLRALYAFQQNGAARQDANVAAYAEKVRSFLADISSRTEGEEGETAGQQRREDEPSALLIDTNLLPEQSTMDVVQDSATEMLSEWTTSPADAFFASTTIDGLGGMDMDMSGLWREWQAFYSGSSGGDVSYAEQQQ